MLKVGDNVWLQLNKERLHGLSKKIKTLLYGPFEILEKVGDNSYWLSLPPYMCIYSHYKKKYISEGHACDEPLRSVTNVTYGDIP